MIQTGESGDYCKEVGRLEVILRMILNYIQPVELEKVPTDPNSLVEIACRGLRLIYGREMYRCEWNCPHDCHEFG